MLLSAVYVLVVAQSSSKFPGGLMNNPVFGTLCTHIYIYIYIYIYTGCQIMYKNFTYIISLKMCIHFLAPSVYMRDQTLIQDIS